MFGNYLKEEELTMAKCFAAAKVDTLQTDADLVMAATFTNPAWYNFGVCESSAASWAAVVVDY